MVIYNEPSKDKGVSQTLYNSQTKWNGKILSFNKPLNKTLHIQQPNGIILSYTRDCENSTILYNSQELKNPFL